MRRREFIILLGGTTATWARAARAQQPRKVYRIGFLANDPTIPTTAAGAAFLGGLRESGFVEGKNIVIERRFAEARSDLYRTLAAELVRLDVDLIVASSSPAVLAARQASKTIPIVMMNVGDPVEVGIVMSLAHPAGNITGVAQEASPEITGKRLELLKEAVPHLSRVAVFFNPDLAIDKAQWKSLEVAARSLHLQLQAVAVRQSGELDVAFSGMTPERPDALFVVRNALNLTSRRRIVELAAENRLPAIYTNRESAEVGGLMSYGSSRPDMFRRAAIYVGKILKGAKPADLPIEQPTKFELVINLKTAKALDLTIPPTLLARADEVIE